MNATTRYAQFREAIQPELPRLKTFDDLACRMSFAREPAVLNVKTERIPRGGYRKWEKLGHVPGGAKNSRKQQ